MSLQPSSVTRLQQAAVATGNGNVLYVNGYAAVAFQVTGTFVATITFEGTVDGTTWVALLATSPTTGISSSTATAAGVYVAACAGLTQVRARATWTSGTSVTVYGTLAAATGGAPGGGTLTGNVPSGSADSGNPIKMGGVYKATPPTLTDGQRGDVELDSRENLKVAIAAVEVVSTASLTTLASAATSAQLLAANTARAGLILVNTDPNTVRVKYGTTASASSFTVAIPQNGYWEMPQPIYTGRLDAIWDADGAGSLFATEL